MNIRKMPLVFAALCAFFLVSMPSFSGCSTPADHRVVAVQSLKAVGQSAEAAVALSAQLYHDGNITARQARQVLDFYNTNFQPAFRLASAAVSADLTSVASPDVAALAAQLSNLVLQFQKQKPSSP